MILKKGDMFKEFGSVDCTLFLVTTNAYVKDNGELVMGRGAALQLKDRVPESPAELGKRIPSECSFKMYDHSSIPYGVVMVDTEESYRRNHQAYGAFQVKRHFKERADLYLIRHSARMLAWWLRDDPDWQNDWVVMNVPGIGAGHLDRAAVLPILEEEFDGLRNLGIYEYE